jgi:hypothetical protein
MSTFPHFLDNRLTDGVEFVSLKFRPSFTSEEVSRYSLVLKFDLSKKNCNLSDECLQCVFSLVCATSMLRFALYIFQRHLVSLFTYFAVYVSYPTLHLPYPASNSANLPLYRFRSLCLPPSASYRMNMEPSAADSNF